MNKVSNILYIIYIILTFIFFIKFSKANVNLGHCEKGTRVAVLEDKSNITFACIDCPEGQYTSYKNKKIVLYCENCPAGSSSYGKDILINNFLSVDLSEKYSFSSFCSIQNDLCPKWKKDYFSIRVNYTKSLSYKSYFTLKQYFMNEGELVIKYMNYNGAIDRVFNIYINQSLVFTDDTNNNVLKTKYFNVKKGENIFMFEYLVNEEMKQKSINDDSFLEIFEIKMKNAETSALNCEKYDSIEKMSKNLLNNCEYDVSKCNANSDYCTYRFYSEIKSDYCLKQLDSFYQEIEYKKIANARCQELINITNQNSSCEYCTYGQYVFYNDVNKTNKTCNYCQNNNYNSKEVNDDTSCKEICEIENNNKQLIKLLYINNFENPNFYNFNNINITQPLGYVIINYEKFNEKSSTIIYVDIDSKNIQKLTEPINDTFNSNIYSFSIPLTYGVHSLSIKGSNLKLNKIVIEGSEKGGNYKCVDKPNIKEEVQCDNETEHFSQYRNKCINCSLGTIIDKNKQCELYKQIINDKYAFDNSDLIKNIFSNSYELINEKVKYYLNINPKNPLIYKKETSSNSDDDIDIIGKEFEYIKIVKGINERGMILSFVSEKNKLFFYIKCNISITEDKKTNIYLKNSTKGNNNINYYFFVIESNTSCPYCVTSEVDIDENNDAKCVNGLKKVNVNIKNDSLCVIKCYDTEEFLILLNETDILLSKNSSDENDQMIINNFEIDEDIPVQYENETDDIIYDNQIEIQCEDEEKIKALTIVSILLICFALFVVLGLGGVLIWKLLDNKKKVKKEVKNTQFRMSELSVITNDD